MMRSSTEKKWWSALSDECPITLEPLSDLPYPPFILYSSKDACNEKRSAAAKTGSQYFFDGLALATYVISQGNFANPLTRSPLSYDDCVRLDDYLNEHVYRNNITKDQLESTVLGREKISVREAYALRNSIKVKLAGNGVVRDENEIRRAEVLRNEAAVALRGLFVFGHHERTSDSNLNRNSTNAANTIQPLPSSAGGFELNHSPDSWGAATMEQDGLRIIDDNEAAFHSADTSLWREIQEAFPPLSGAKTDAISNTRQSHCDGSSGSHMLEIARRAADITLKEEKQKSELRERNRQLYFTQALERKKQRISARQKAKAEAAKALCNEQKAKDELHMAMNEIDRWREQQWQKWEKDNLKHSEVQTQKSLSLAAVKSPPSSIEEDDSIKEHEKQAAAEEEAHVKAAAKKKAKRQRAKERAKVKKKEEQLANEEKERAIRLQSKKDNSDVKCGACGEGVLGFGFEKFGMKFCSTKCARSGPS